MSVRLSSYITAAPTGKISVKFGIEGFYKKNCRNPNLVKIGQKYRALYIRIYEVFIVAGDIKSPYNRCFRLEWYQNVIADEV
jgi:hypothetical protein